MTITKDGILAAVAREEELLPKTTRGKEITAWRRRGVTLEATIEEVNRLREDLDRLREEVLTRPF